MKGTKVATMVLVSIILTVVVVAAVNVGLTIFLDEPEYGDFCDWEKMPITIDTIEVCESVGGKWTSQEIKCVSEPCPQGFCDADFICREEYDKARDDFNQIRFYVFAIIGLLLLIGGLFIDDISFRSVGLASGGILIFEGVVTNFDNKITVFVLLLIILVVFGYLGRRVLKKMKG
jgi:hypothetical protein